METTLWDELMFGVIPGLALFFYFVGLGMNSCHWKNIKSQPENYHKTSRTFHLFVVALFAAALFSICSGYIEDLFTKLVVFNLSELAGIVLGILLIIKLCKTRKWFKDNVAWTWIHTGIHLYRLAASLFIVRSIYLLYTQIPVFGIIIENTAQTIKQYITL